MNHPDFLANENVPAPLVRLLREQGLVVHAVGEFMPSASHRIVLQHAQANGLWLLTFDRDYGELVFARQAPPPPAIVYLRQCPEPMTSFMATVLALLADTDRLRGHLVVVEGRRVRRRPLPPPL